MTKTIVVTGATGNQGGAVVRHLLNTEFAIKAVSRSLHSPAAQKLREMGVEVVQGDLDKPETLGPILDGAHGVFFGTEQLDQQCRNRDCAGQGAG
ncbi:NmrA family NAD(P)-binding protein [Aliiroseovarius sp.]|uniref:NmrA family NAD(P)-binding protein n=1 Tax=Aliiroseovarius sp. TaxID=1872442 RepID=UPI003BAC8469